jgi:hypothetical protein
MTITKTVIIRSFATYSFVSANSYTPTDFVRAAEYIDVTLKIGNCQTYRRFSFLGPHCLYTLQN